MSAVKQLEMIFDFVLEVHRGMTLPEAVAFGRAVEPYRPMILEDPVPPDNVDTMAEVASKVAFPLPLESALSTCVNLRY